MPAKAGLQDYSRKYRFPEQAPQVASSSGIWEVRRTTSYELCYTVIMLWQTSSLRNMHTHPMGARSVGFTIGQTYTRADIFYSASSPRHELLDGLGDCL